jgi:hypothetical protein
LSSLAHVFSRAIEYPLEIPGPPGSIFCTPVTKPAVFGDKPLGSEKLTSCCAPPPAATSQVQGSYFAAAVEASPPRRRRHTGRQRDAATPRRDAVTRPPSSSTTSRADQGGRQGLSFLHCFFLRSKLSKVGNTADTCRTHGRASVACLAVVSLA